MSSVLFGTRAFSGAKGTRKPRGSGKSRGQRQPELLRERQLPSDPLSVADFEDSEISGFYRAAADGTFAKRPEKAGRSKESGRSQKQQQAPAAAQAQAQAHPTEADLVAMRRREGMLARARSAREVDSGPSLNEVEVSDGRGRGVGYYFTPFERFRKLEEGISQAATFAEGRQKAWERSSGKGRHAEDLGEEAEAPSAEADLPAKPTLFGRLADGILRRTARHEQRAVFLELAHEMLAAQQRDLRRVHAEMFASVEGAAGPSAKAGAKAASRAETVKANDVGDNARGEGAAGSSSAAKESLEEIQRALAEPRAVVALTAELRTSATAHTCGSGMLVVNPPEPLQLQWQMGEAMPWLANVLRADAVAHASSDAFTPSPAPGLDKNGVGYFLDVSTY